MVNMDKKNLTLAINTATSHTSIALLTEEGALLAEKAWESANNEAEKLMPAIKELLEEAGKAASLNSDLDFKDIKKVIVVKGPGSFTGLRVGITVANTIAYLNKCEISSLTTFEYLHRLVSDKKTEISAKIPVLLFAGKGGVYLSEAPDSEPRIVDLPDLPEAVKNFSKLTGDISEEQKELLKSFENPPQFIDPKKTFGEVIVEFLKDSTSGEEESIPGDASSHKQQEPAKGEINLVKPLYIKQPSITKSKKRMSFA